MLEIDRKESPKPQWEYFEPGKPTLPQLIEVWAYTHPDPYTQIVEGGGKKLTPSQFSSEVNSEKATAAKIVVAALNGLPEASTWYEKQIEANLAGALPSGYKNQPETLQVHRKYVEAMNQLPGVKNFTPGNGNSELTDGLVVEVSNRYFLSKMPYTLDGIKVTRALRSDPNSARNR